MKKKLQHTECPQQTAQGALAAAAPETPLPAQVAKADATQPPLPPRGTDAAPPAPLSLAAGASDLAGAGGPARATPPSHDPEKPLEITLAGQRYQRWCIRTHLVTAQDDLAQLVRQYALPWLRAGDILFITEKAVACTQGRAIPLADIRPRPLARFLSRFVLRTPYGIGLAMPQTMECALRECGTPRILLAATVSAVGKLLGRRGWFYRVAGEQARSIDGPCDCTIPPYNRCVVLGPLHADAVAAQLAAITHTAVAITDINDLGGNIMGLADCALTRAQLCAILRDNPLGQGCQCTPMGIIRRVDRVEDRTDMAEDRAAPTRPAQTPPAQTPPEQTRPA